MDNLFFSLFFFLCSNFAIVVQVQVPLVAVPFLPADKTAHDKGNCPLLILSIRDGDNEEEEEEGDGGGNHHRPSHREDIKQDDHGQDDPFLVSSDEPGTAGKNSITKVGQVVWCGCSYI